MYKYFCLPLIIFFLSYMRSYGQELSSKKPIFSIPMSMSWADPNGMVLSTGINIGFQVKERLLIGPEVNYSMNGKAYQNVNLGAFARFYFTKESNSFFTEVKYLQGITRRNYLNGITGESYEIAYYHTSNTYLGGGFKYDNKKGKKREVLVGIKVDNRAALLTVSEYILGFRFYLHGKSK